MEKRNFSILQFPEVSGGSLPALLLKPQFSLILSLSCLVLLCGYVALQRNNRRRDNERMLLALKNLRVHLDSVGTRVQQQQTIWEMPPELTARMQRLEDESLTTILKVQALQAAYLQKFSIPLEPISTAGIPNDGFGLFDIPNGAAKVNLSDFKREVYHLANQLLDGPDAKHADAIKEFADGLVPEPEPEPEAPTTITVTGTPAERAAALMEEVNKLVAQENAQKQSGTSMYNPPAGPPVDPQYQAPYTTNV